MTNFQMWILVVILVNYKVNLTLKKNLQQKRKKLIKLTISIKPRLWK